MADNTDKRPKSVRKRIIETLDHGGLIAEMYYVSAIDMFKECIDSKTNEEVDKMFEGIVDHERVRSNIEYIYNTLHPQKNDKD